MKSEQDVKALSPNKRGKQPEQLTSVDTDDFNELKKRELNLPPVWRTIESSADTDEFDEPKKRGLNLRPVLRTIRRNVLLITGVTTIVGVTALYSGLLSPPSQVYKGDFRLLVEPITSEAKFTDPSVLSRDGGVSTTNTVDYPTLLQVLQSPGLMSKIAKQIQARYPDVNYDSLSTDLVVQRIGTNLTDATKLIEVRYQGEDPKKVQFVLEEFAKGYLKYSLEDRKTRIGEGVKFIEDQLPRLQQQVDTLEGQLQALQQRYKLSAPASEGAQLSEQLREIQAQKLQAQREMQELNMLYANLQKQLELTPNEAIAASTISEDPNYQELVKQLKQVESQIAVESARFNEENPVIQTLREKQKNLSLLLNQETRRIVGQDIPSTVGKPQVPAFQNSVRQELIKQMVATANQAQVLKVRDRAITQVEALLNQQVQQFPAITRRYNDLQRRLDIATKTLNQLLIQRETLRVEAAQKEVPWEVVSAPRIPRDATGNPIPVADGSAQKTLLMTAIAGLVLGLGAAVLKDKYRNIFYTSEDIQDAIQLPVLGVIPVDKIAKQFPNFSAAVGSIEETEASYCDPSPFLQGFNSLYTSIRFLASDPPVRSLVVSSAEPGDGKTTIALHLATTAAVMGQRVLLVDANLRLPQLHTRLGLPNLQGLSNLLSQNLDPLALIQRSPLKDNLFVLTSGQLLPESHTLLASTRMQHLMEQFQTAFDLVIYDTSHLVELPDANFLAAHTDGLLMVVGVRKTKCSVVMQVMNKLNTYRLPILGIVANYGKESTNSSYNYHNHYSEQNPQVHPALASSKSN